jgi:hypothetical protein
MSYTIVSASPPLCAFSRVGHKDSSFRLGDSDLVMFHILVNKCAYLCELSSGGAGCNTLTPVTAFANDPSASKQVDGFRPRFIPGAVHGLVVAGYTPTLYSDWRCVSVSVLWVGYHGSSIGLRVRQGVTRESLR